MLSRLRDRHPADLVFWAAIPVSIVLLTYLTRHAWFRGDEFNFLVGRRRGWAEGHYIDVLFAPHMEHWSTGPIVLYLGLFRVFRFSSYLPYLALVWVFHVTVAVCLRLVLLRVGVGRWLAAAGGVVVLLLGSGMENLVWAFQLGFVGTVALGLIALLLSDHDGPLGRRDVLGVAVLVVALTFTGVALTMVFVVGFNACWRRRWTTAGVYVGAAGLAYGIWYRGWGHNAHRFPTDLAAVPPYVWRGLTAGVDGVTQLKGAAAALLVLALVGLALRARRGPLPGLLLSCSAGAVVFFVLAGVGRAGIGIEQASASRYVYVAGVLLLPALLALLDELVSMSAGWQPWAVVAILVTWAVVGNLADGVVITRESAGWADQLRERLAATAALPSFPALDGTTQPEPTLNPGIDVAGLREFVSSDGLDLPAVGPVALLAAALTTEVRPGTGVAGDPRSAALTAGADTSASDEGSCVRLRSATGTVSGVVVSEGRTEIVVEGSDKPVSIRLLGGDGLATEPTELTPVGGQVAIGLDHLDYPLELSAPAGSLLVCGAHAEPTRAG